MSGARSSGVIGFSVLLAFFHTSCWGILSGEEEACASNGPTRRPMQLALKDGFLIP